MELSEKKCIPCQKGMPPLPLEEKFNLLHKIHSDWKLTHDNTRLWRDFPFPDFAEAMEFAILIGDLAEELWHHPELHIGFGHAGVEIWTHKINDLVESDFILAAKVDKVFEKSLLV